MIQIQLHELNRVCQAYGVFGTFNDNCRFHIRTTEYAGSRIIESHFITQHSASLVYAITINKKGVKHYHFACGHTSNYTYQCLNGLIRRYQAEILRDKADALDSANPFIDKYRNEFAMTCDEPIGRM